MKILSGEENYKMLTTWDPAVTRSPDSSSGENKTLGVGESGLPKRHSAGKMNHPPKKSKWSLRYGNCHRYVPILDDPLLPNSRRGRIRIYRRGVEDASGQQRFVLNWFESGRNRKRTMLGDKFTAVAEADRINHRLSCLGWSGLEGRQVSLPLLLDRYFEHLEERSDAGEISTRTAARYKNALRYLHRFAEENVDISQAAAGKVDDHFVLGFKAYLRSLKIHPNGHRNTQPKPFSESGIRFVMSVARSAWHWALQHNPPLLPEGACNPFRGHVGPRPAKDLVTQPALNVGDIVSLIEVADIYQLILLMPLTLYGLRAGEPCYIMVEDWNRKEQFLTVSCVPDLEYKTKGRIAKSFPVPPIFDRLLTLATAGRCGGPLLPGRVHFEDKKVISPLLATKQQMIDEYRRRINGDRSARQRLKALEGLFREAGAVTYDQLSREFQKMACRANLPTSPTLKSLRHHFAAALEKANISYFTRKYFMGHRVRRDPLAIYTTTDLEGIRLEFDRLLHGPMAPILTVATQRTKQLEGIRNL